MKNIIVLLASFLALSEPLETHAEDKPIVLKGHNGRVQAIAFSPDGSTLASGGIDNKVRLWEIPGGHPKLTLNMIGAAESVAFSPDGAILAAGSNIGDIFLLDLAAGKTRFHTKIGYPEGETGAQIAFSPDSKFLARGSYGRREVLLLWELGQNQPKILLKGELVFAWLSHPTENCSPADIPE